MSVQSFARTSRFSRAGMLGVVLSALVACQPTPPSPPTTTTTQPSSSTIFVDEFDGSSINAAWAVMNRPGDASNSEQQCYRPSNAVVSGGSLKLTAINDTSCAGFS